MKRTIEKRITQNVYKNKDFEVNYQYDDGEEGYSKLSHLCFQDDCIVYLIIGPHSGNHYHWILRANAIKTLDRWSVCEFEKQFENGEDLLYYLQDERSIIERHILKRVLEYVDIQA